MKWSFSIISLMVTMMASFVRCEEQRVISEIYSLHGDFNKLRASAHIQFELTHVNSKPSITIETEQWLHTGRYITVTTRPNECLDIKLVNDINYPAIKVYVNYSTPLVSLEVEEASSVRSMNVIFSNPSSLLSVAHSGTGRVVFELQHTSDINIALSGTGSLILSGRVQGNGQLSISGTAHLDAITCPMKTVTVALSGAASAYVYGVEGVRATLSGIGTICYRGPLLSQEISGLGSIRECIIEQTSVKPQQTTVKPQQTTVKPQQTTVKPQHSSSKSDKIIDRKQRLMVILITTLFFLFF